MTLPSMDDTGLIAHISQVSAQTDPEVISHHSLKKKKKSEKSKHFFSASERFKSIAQDLKRLEES